MSTSIRQEQVAKNLVENTETKKFNTMRELLIASGYSELNALQNGKTIVQSKGVQDALVKFGFREDTAKAVVAEIMLTGTESNRLAAAREVFKITGSYAPEKSINIGYNVTEIINKLDSNAS